MVANANLVGTPTRSHSAVMLRRTVRRLTCRCRATASSFIPEASRPRIIICISDGESSPDSGVATSGTLRLHCNSNAACSSSVAAPCRNSTDPVVELVSNGTTAILPSTMIMVVGSVCIARTSKPSRP